MKTFHKRRDFLKTSAVTASLLGMGPIMPASPPSRKEEPRGRPPRAGAVAPVCRAGFAERDITPAIGMEEPGGYGKVFHKKLHDPCKVRAAVFHDGRKRVALVGIDAIFLHNDSVAEARKGIEAACGIPPEAVLIGASHSHSSGPVAGVMPGEYDAADPLVQELAYKKSTCVNPDYHKHVIRQLVEAVAVADRHAGDVTVGVGSGIEDKVAFNRRFYMKNGLSFTHPGQMNPDIIRPAGPVDPEVGVIGVWDQSGKCIGCVVNYTCHATTNPGGISANWIYYLEQTIRGAMGPDCVVVFLQGAAGDVTQVDNRNRYVNRQGEDWARFVGTRVGAEAIKVLMDMPRGVNFPLDYRQNRSLMKRRFPSREKVAESYALVRKTPEEVGATRWTFAKEIVLLDAKLKTQPEVWVEVQTVQLGPAVFVTNPAEFFCQLGLDLKKGSPFRYTFVVMLANGCVGYVPDEKAFDSTGGGYETRLTSYSNLEKDAGTRMVRTGLDLLKQMTPAEAPEAVPAPVFSGKPWEYGSLPPELN